MGILRFVLALGVLIEHAKLTESAAVYGIFRGGYAVPVFFMISGFYMSLVLNTKYEAGAKGTATFYLSRYLRLWPTYIVVLLVFLNFRPIRSVWDISPSAQIFVYFVAATMFGYELLQWVAINRSSSTIYWNDTCQLTPNHSTLDMLIYMRPMWSVGVELWFYVVAPFVMRAIRPLVWLLGLAAAIHLILVNLFDAQHPLAYRNAFNYLYLFLAGGLGYHFYAKVLKERNSSRYSLTYSLVLLFVLLFNFGALLEIIKAKTGLDTRLCQDLLYLPIAGLIPFAFQLTKHSMTDRLIGDLSYPLYVVHYPLFAILGPKHSAHPDWAFYAIFYPICAAIVLEFFIAHPIEKLRAALVKRGLEHAKPSS